ncbi:hypothetical protein OOU_Y34scaffold00519g4 [Pyricularia oryzae Y34]|uniref:Uncharacterized protein n=2 Tax=Pyricularia oryzae TaxID=318829 RepID=A0AA97NZ07_PYRO3|nr:hypothetical protein OOU_Y34scaffold00519g4 [Pyricularia oryzae Y34]
MHISTLSQLLAMLALSATVLSAPTPIAASADDGHPGGPRAAAACQVPRLQVRAQRSRFKWETLILTPSWTLRTPMKRNLMWLKGSGMHVVTKLLA